MFHSLLSKHWRKLLFPLIIISAILAILSIPRGREEKEPIVLSEQIPFLEDSNEEIEPVDDQEAHEEVSTIIIVDVRGAVAHPGVYALEDDDRLIDAINAAGGYVEGADTRLINHAQKLADEMLIYIPTEGEEELEAGTATEVQSTVTMPHASSSESDTVNLNTATEVELMTLSGVGPAKAEAIIQYREEHGSFQTEEDLMNISGFGQKTFEKLQPHISVK